MTFGWEKKTKRRLFTYFWSNSKTTFGISSRCNRWWNFKWNWKKIFGDKKRRRKRRTRTNNLLQRLHNLRGVQPPNGHVLFVKDERVHRHSIVPNQVRIARKNAQKIGPSRKRIERLGLRNERKWRQQPGAGLNIATAIDIAKRAAGSKLAKMIIIYVIDYIPTAYKRIKNRITKKKVKAVMNTAVNNYLVNRGVELTGERFN